MFRLSFSKNVIFSKSQKKNYSTISETLIDKNKLFDKILVASRGEMAIRIMRTCKLLGIKTVSVYTPSDVQALHVSSADESFSLEEGGYENYEKVVEAAKITGAQAVHSSFPFLSRNFNFVKSLEKNGLSFIGPSSNSIKLMGDRIETKKLAKEVGVNVIPGKAINVKTEEDAIKLAREIGYPVVIKSSLGYDGNAISVARITKEQRKEKELLAVFKDVKKKAKELYGNDKVMMEKLIEYPRHLDIQLLADQHGSLIAMKERERTIQKGYQTVLGESPSTFITPDIRQQIADQAIAIGKAVGLTNAATVEILIDPDRNFYFLELNPTFSPLHSLSEMVSSVDIVEHLIRSSSSLPLSLSSSPPLLKESSNEKMEKGWAMTGGITREDPLKDFSPSTGTLECYVEAEMTSDVVIDSSVTEGSSLLPSSDLSLSKITTRGVDRMEAVENMVRALDTFRIIGVNNNISMLRSIMTNSRFLAGDLCTEFFSEEYPDGFSPQYLTVERDQLIVTAALMFHTLNDRNNLISGQLDSHSSSLDTDQLVVVFNDKEYDISLETNQDGDQGTVTVNGEEFKVEYQWDAAAPYFESSINNQQVIIQYLGQFYDGLYLQHCGHNVYIKVRTSLQHKMWKFINPKK